MRTGDFHSLDMLWRTDVGRLKRYQGKISQEKPQIEGKIIQEISQEVADLARQVNQGKMTREEAVRKLRDIIEVQNVDKI